MIGLIRGRHDRDLVPVRDRLPVAAVGVCVDRGSRRVLDDVTVTVSPGELVAVIGPNGAGKSTLLGALAGDHPLADGRVSIGGHDLASTSARRLATLRAVLPQDTALAFPFTVREVVAMGRAPWSGTHGACDDDLAVTHALAEVEAQDLAHRRYPTLSGGERARVALARVLVQDTPVVLLDEPTAALDLRHEELVLRLAARVAQEGRAVAAVLHDLGAAAAHADRVVVVADGGVVAAGPPAEVLTIDLLEWVYGHPVQLLADPVTGRPVPIPRR